MSEKVIGPIRLTPHQRRQVERRIAEFVEDSSALGARAWAREAVATLNALPLLFDWTAFMALLPDGHVAWVPYDGELGVLEVVEEDRVRNIGLFRGAGLHPGLQFLLPLKPPDAIECPDCRGTGTLAFPPGSEHLADKVNCYCGGMGWLPPTRASN